MVCGCLGGISMGTGGGAEEDQKEESNLGSDAAFFADSTPRTTGAETYCTDA